jgi:hypothetical protein
MKTKSSYILLSSHMCESSDHECSVHELLGGTVEYTERLAEHLRHEPLGGTSGRHVIGLILNRVGGQSALVSALGFGRRVIHPAPTRAGVDRNSRRCANSIPGVRVRYDKQDLY